MSCFPHKSPRGGVPVRRTARRGVALTELVLTLPTLVLLLSLGADLGRALGPYQTVTNAARVGLETAATKSFTSYTYDSWEAEIVTAVQEEAAGIVGFDPSLLSVEVSAAEDADGLQEIEVSVTYQFQPVLKLVGLPETVPLQARSCGRQIH